MLPYPQVPRDLQRGPAYPRNLGPQMPQFHPLYPNYQTSSYSPMEIDCQILQEPTRNSCFQMAQSPLEVPEISMQSSIQWQQNPERYLSPQVCPGPSTKTRHQDSLMYPGCPTPGIVPVNPCLQEPYCPSVCSCSQGSLGSPELSDKYGDKQGHAKAPTRQRKERTMYSEEQKLLLQERFDQCMNPSQEQRVELAQRIGVTEYEIKIWFKNQRAKYNKKNSQKIQEGLPGKIGCCNSVPELAGSHVGLNIICSVNGDSTSLGTSGMGSIPNPNSCLDASPQGDQTCEGAGYSSQEDMLGSQAPSLCTAVDQDQFMSVDALTASEVSEGQASAEAPVPTAAVSQGPGDAQDQGPSAEELWQRVLEDLESLEDWVLGLYPDFDQFC